MSINNVISDLGVCSSSKETCCTASLKSSIDLEKIANTSIADYGFKHKEKPSDREETYRTEIRRQRDRILYTGGFRRLQDKTQVMSATLTGDHRTRLTHTMEVEQIAISISDALSLNRDLVSAIALGHDVGHTPFGHAAERTLDRLLKENGGFHHPIQSVKYLWEKYGDGIINEIYEGILAHDSDMFTIEKENSLKQLSLCQYKDKDCNDLAEYINKLPGTLEAQVVIWADKIAYITHDLEDFLHSPIYSDVVTSEGKDTTIEKKICDILSKITEKNINTLKDFESRDLIRAITTNLIKTSIENINEQYPMTQSQVSEKTTARFTIKASQNPQIDKKKQYLNSLIINFEDGFRESYYALRSLLDEHYIFSPVVQRSDAKAAMVVKTLFNEFADNYKLLPLEIRKKIDDTILCKVREKKMLEENAQEDDDYSSVKKIEKYFKENRDKYELYKDIRSDIVNKSIASYISTMSDTYAENMYCNLRESKDNYRI